jgi:hypothetical protein
MPLDLYDDESPPTGLERPFIGVLFDCCGVYERIYRAPEHRVYRGRCPRCLRPIQIRVRPDGTRARLFRAS